MRRHLCLITVGILIGMPTPATGSTSGSWTRMVGEQIRESEYNFSAIGDDVWSAPNRIAGLRSRVTTEGLEVRPRSTIAVPWRMSMKLDGYGRESNVVTPAVLGVVASGRNLTIQRSGIELRTRNDASGLVPGLLIDAPPEGGIEDGDLRVDLALAGDLTPTAPPGGYRIVFEDGGAAAVLQYAGVQARDASGTLLPTRIELGPGRASILVDDTGAIYPIELDASLTQPSWIVEGNQAGGRFGTSTKSAGDVNGDGYDDVIVGAFTFDNGQTDEGKAFVYLGSATGLSLTPAWTAESNNSFAHLGIEVGTAGDVNGDGYDDVIVGADLFDGDLLNEGRVFVYHGSASGLSASPAWFVEGNQTNAGFGFSAASAGDVDGDGFDDVIVGAHLYSNDEGGEGRASLYPGSVAGLSTTPVWVTEGNQTSSDYGNNVSGAGDLNADGYGDVIVCAGFYTNGQFREGRAFVYLGSPSGLPAAPSWTAESDQAEALFCSGVGTAAGDVNGDGFDDLLIGAHRYDNGQDDEGAVFVFLGSPSGPGAAPSWMAESDQAGSGFGRWAASAGDVDGDGFDDVVVGAWLYDNGQADEGGIFVYGGSASGLSLAPDWTAESDQAGAHLGIACAGAGDVNGDGFGDVIAGAYDYDNGETDEGLAVLYLGSPQVCDDLDGDGFGSPGRTTCPAGAETDCDDDDPSVFPGAAERCDGLDGDCDGAVDEGFDVGQACSVGVGGCQAIGVAECDPAGSGTVCGAVPGVPGPELCDGVDNDCDGAVDDGAIEVSAEMSISPTTLNVNSQGTSFSMTLSTTNVCDPANVEPIGGQFVDRAWISRVGPFVLPDPASIPCPGPSGDLLFERGIVEDMTARGVTNNKLSLKFSLASDGDCRTLDGDRQDLIALLAGAVDNSEYLVCLASTAAGIPFEACTSTTVKNRGNR